jgi:cell division protein FtsX
MDLVGAPARVVRAPFVLESVTVCMLGAMAATGVLTLGVGKVLPGVASGSGLQLIGTQHALRLGVWMLLGSVLIGWLVSRVSLRLGSREED